MRRKHYLPNALCNIGSIDPLVASRYNVPQTYKQYLSCDEDVGGKYLGQPDSDTRWKSAVLHLRKTHASRSRMPAE